MHSKVLILITILAANCFAQVSATQSQQIADSIKSVDAYLTNAEQKGFTGAVLISKDGQTLMNKGYGFSDCIGKTRITPDMIFDIGSITKNLTAFAIFKLQAQGKLRISEPISKYLKDVPPDKAMITFDQLIQHTAGMPDIFGADEDYVDRAWFVKKALSEPLIGVPGEKREYSNAGYSLLGVLIETISGESYEAYVNKNVLEPAGINQTGYLLPKLKKNKIVCGVLNDKRWGSVKDYYGKTEPSWHLLANGGMLSTVNELDIWFRAVLDNKIVPIEMTNAWLERVGRKTLRNTRYVATSGSNNIFSALYVRYLEDNASVVIFTANNKWQKEQVQGVILDAMGKINTAK